MSSTRSGSWSLSISLSRIMKWKVVVSAGLVARGRNRRCELWRKADAAPGRASADYSGMARCKMDTHHGANADNDFDAIVIGAGAAGLATARRLCDAGISIAVLEARDRIGDRS